MWEFWIDRGGTFTDVVARQPDGTLATMKLLSEAPEHYDDAAVEAIRRFLDVAPDAPVPADRIAAVKMGTTVATNALLERKGARTVLVTTAGFADLLRIGYQNRPRLFDLDIRLPDLLHECVIEARERLAPNGDILTPLDEAGVLAALEAARADGIQSVAIALMHGYRHPDHENRIAVLARQAGFSQVSVSSTVSPLAKLVSRGDTTVVDAYLSPVLRRYVGLVETGLGGGNASVALSFMQSNGGLTDARLFQGKDAILSGPAGGVVGMVRSAEMAGFDKLIGFDMGGTSTDVCHYAGDYERSYETEVAGVRMRAPMMDIHTVAAGGGSILAFEHGRLRVGPESAGANPGPAAYRRGGPLTVTDCNVMLGKIAPDRFPHVFGPNADEPLDAAIVETKFRTLARRIADETGTPERSPEELAEGFLAIAVTNMANAIKKISVERGHDVTRYTLNCFGGAGGQHACLVADELGMDRVFIHPFAGVLSAFGMGLAPVTAMRQVTIDRPIGDDTRLREAAAALAGDAQAELLKQGFAAQTIRTSLVAHVRVAGSHEALPVSFAAPSAMAEEFAEAHRQRFGFAHHGADLVVEMLSAEARAETGQSATAGAAYATDIAETGKAQVFTDGAKRDIPVVDRRTLNTESRVAGPAIITEPTGTNMIEPGWTARADTLGNLIIERTTPRPQRIAIGTTCDPVMLEVFNNLYMSIATQMGVTLANTAFSVNIRERLDFSCAIFDASGGLVANAPHVPVHLGSMGESVASILRDNRDTMKPGDVFMMNDPYDGGTHLPDVTVVTPVFDEQGDMVFAVASRGHHADIGGRTPGSAPPDSRHIDEEGVLIRNVRLVDGGRFDEDAVRSLLASAHYPARNPDQNIADLKAQIAANATGSRELMKLVATFGRETVAAYMTHVQDNAEESVRRVIGNLRDGRHVHVIDDGSQIAVSITVDRDNRKAVIDFTGTSPQNPRNYNAPRAICRAVVLYVFRTLVGADIPLNDGCLKPLDIIIPEHSMINPEAPAAVIAGNTEVSQAIAEALYGALGVLAGSQGTMNNFVYGNDDFQNYETICGGAGAGPDFDGASAVHTHMTNTRMTDPEILENRFPLMVERFAIRRGSGGQGRHRGGDGIERVIRFDAPVTVTVLSSSRLNGPRGMEGGHPGKTGHNLVIRANGDTIMLDGNDTAELAPGDRFVMETPGGGGWG